MDEGMDILKILNYDKFKCTADKCTFTCCAGWDVSIDNDTYTKWEKEKDRFDYILKNVKTKKCGSKTEYSMDKETVDDCPFLDTQGLCQIVKISGEDCLSLTCRSFPRIENIFEDRRELSLSCACPEVVEIIGSVDGKIDISSEKNTNLKNNFPELRIRDVIINIINQEKFLLEEKLIISFEMLLDILENKNVEENSLLEKIEEYNKTADIQKHIDTYKEIKLNRNDSIEEINYLFLDIIQNYKEVSILEELFKDISKFAETVKIKSLSANWKEYKSLFEEHNKLIGNCIIAKILSSCVSDDIEEMTVAFEMIMLEYLLVRYAVFLKYCMNKNEKINEEDIKDYIVAFSRIIGNNNDAMIEFFKDGFGKAILEMGYLCFITLF